jgi:hypothetical protein
MIGLTDIMMSQLSVTITVLWDSYPMTIGQEETHTIGRDSKRIVPARTCLTSLSVA